MPKRKRDGTPSSSSSSHPPPPILSPEALASASHHHAFQEQQMTLKMSLAPYAMEDLAKHIQLRLNSLLMKYNEEAGGVILSLSNVKLPHDRPYATIMDDLPYLHIHVMVTALVFVPSKGITLKGTIIKVASTHIAMLVYGIFNAAVATEDMPKTYIYNEYAVGGAIWRDNSEGEGKGRTLAIGDSLDFRVLRVHEAAGLISLDGSLRDPVADGDDDDDEEDGEEGGKKKKRKEKKKEGGEKMMNGHRKKEEEEEGGGGKKKKKEKKKKDKKEKRKSTDI